MRDERDRREVRDDVGPHLGHDLAQTLAVEQVDGMNVIADGLAVMGRAKDSVSRGLQLGEQVTPGETVDAGDQRPPHGSAQNDTPCAFRIRSASTIILHNSSRVALGSQPSSRFAFSGLPISISTSAGR